MTLLSFRPRGIPAEARNPSFHCITGFDRKNPAHPTEPDATRRPWLQSWVPPAPERAIWHCCIAEKFNGEIVNCDSLQVYRHFDIGTAKLPLAERRGIPHHLIDILDPDQLFTAGEYARLARDNDRGDFRPRPAADSCRRHRLLPARAVGRPVRRSGPRSTAARPPGGARSPAHRVRCIAFSADSIPHRRGEDSCE